MAKSKLSKDIKVINFILEIFNFDLKLKYNYNLNYLEMGKCIGKLKQDKEGEKTN